MPIRIEGGSYRAGGWWAKHLQRVDTNERVQVIEMRGLASPDLAGAFSELEAMASGTRGANYFFQANINPRADEHLTPEQWERAVDVLEKNLGLTGQPRFVVEHEKAGRVHRHVVWSRVDPDSMTLINDSHNLYIRERTAHELERDFGLEIGRSINEVRQEPGREQKWEIFRGKDSGIRPHEVAEHVKALLGQADNGQAFVAALAEAGYISCQGDKRDFCILDLAGDVHSLGRRVGMKAAAFKAFMADVDRASLPSVAQAQELFATREQEREREQGRGEGGGVGAATYQPLREDNRLAYIEQRREQLAHVTTVKDIGMAWAESHSGTAFVQQLEERGLTVLCATERDAEHSRANRQWLEAGKALEAGDYLVMNEHGHSYRLNATTIHDTEPNIAARLDEIDASEQLSVMQGNDLAHHWRLEAAEPAPYQRPLASGIAHEMRHAGDALLSAGERTLHAGGTVLRMGSGLARGVISLGESIMDFLLGGTPSPQQSQQATRLPERAMANEPPKDQLRNAEPTRALDPTVQQQARTQGNTGNAQLDAALQRYREAQARQRERDR